MREGLDHWTTGPLIPLTEFVLTSCMHTQNHVHFGAALCDLVLYWKISESLTKVCTDLMTFAYKVRLGMHHCAASYHPVKARVSVTVCVLHSV